MNENIDLTKILKNCPKGTKLYSPLFGEVTLCKVIPENAYSIQIATQTGGIVFFNKYGIYNSTYAGAECLLFPSKDQRDWSKFKCPKPKKPKFDPKTLQPFDKVLARELYHGWFATCYSHTINNRMMCNNNITYPYCIPYNEDTKHLVGTMKEAPEYYRYWED